MSVAPRKQFSQNFLTDQNIARRIVEALPLTNTSEVIEIGPGTGALTRWLSESPAERIVAVDVDRRAIEHCSVQPWSGTRVEYIQADVRRLSPATLFQHPPGFLIGNLPYGISSDLLFWILDERQSITTAVIMLQREVAQRLVGRPGSKDYGILSASIWQAATAEIMMNVQPGSFFPRPSVVSSVVRLHLRTHPPVPVPDLEFRAFVRAAFSQRRKVLSNCLKSWASQRAVQLTDSVIPLHQTRAEQLHPEELAHLFLRLQHETDR